MEEDKLTISVNLFGKMKEHFLKRQDELGLKRSELIRKFVADDMEKCKEFDKPQIVYYGSETTIPSGKPIPHSVSKEKRPLEVASMMSVNAEMKKLLEATGMNPRRALKKVIRNEAQVSVG